MTETISSIKSLLKQIDDISDIRLLEWRTDSRLGVQTALKVWDKHYSKLRQQEKAFQKRFSFERHYWHQGITHIAGIDEVGRGPLAGPVIAAAVILPSDFYNVDVIDSKQLSAKKREELYHIIIEQAVSIGVGVVDAATIDDINIYQAAKLAMTKAVKDLAPEPEVLLIDAMSLDVPITQESLIKGDTLSNSIGAASIIAKVTRDRLMAEYSMIYPGYGFSKNAGYGTKEHLAGLKKRGITPIHRLSFQPVHDQL
ncbi:ribonuclease HII [Leuconostoc gelidum subsp. aenigmaticum]|uniref:ribonuclease HII n=1 Tax=Leuconostoc gelidum TaxID=1244 RepID=UPI001CC425C2|nr:ribonuclease HII [Leuconostoc gelidum]MBZ6008330.1 ribonuclease HII [Leuconostoc gelidum subsp. aenigmaticum]